jgi:hypothetical protein
MGEGRERVNDKLKFKIQKAKCKLQSKIQNFVFEKSTRCNFGFFTLIFEF